MRDSWYNIGHLSWNQIQLRKVFANSLAVKSCDVRKVYITKKIDSGVALPITLAKVVSCKVEPVVSAKVVVSCKVEPVVPTKVVSCKVEPVVLSKVVSCKIEPVVSLKIVSCKVEPVVLSKIVSCKVKPIVPVKIVSCKIEPVVPKKIVSFKVEPVVSKKIVSCKVKPVVPKKIVSCKVEPVVLTKVVSCKVEPVVALPVVVVSVDAVPVQIVIAPALVLPVQTPVFQKKRIKKRKNKKLETPVVNNTKFPVFTPVFFGMAHVCGKGFSCVCGLKLSDVILAHQGVIPTLFFNKVVWSTETYWKSALSVLVKRSLIRHMTEETRYKLVKLWTVVLPEFQKWFDLNLANRAILTTAMQKMRMEKHPLTAFRSGFRVINLSFSKNVYTANIGNWGRSVDAGEFLPNWSIHVSNLGTRGIFSIPIVVQFDFYETGATTPVFVDLDRLPFSEHMAEWVAYRQSVLLRYNLVIRHAVLHRWVKPRLQAMRLIARFGTGCGSRLRTTFFFGDRMQKTDETKQFYSLVEESPFILGQFLE